jgi:signal transduction histidine kinase
LAHAGRVRIAWAQDRKCDTPASTDGLRIRQVLINTLRNAIQHSPAYETVGVVAGDDGTMLTFAVTDRGPGIDTRQQEVLFEAFTRDSEAYVGAGLGLTLSRRLARLLGGDLTVQSQLGKGATFTLRVPRSLPSPG